MARALDTRVDAIADLPAPTVAVFSFPGALVDTKGALENSILDVYYESPLLTVFGTADEVKGTVRANADRSSMAIVRSLTRSEDHARRIHALVERAYQKRSRVSSAAEGAVDLIERVKDAALSVALTTQLSRANRESLLDHLGWRGLADVQLGPEDGGRPSPAPDLVLTSLLRVGAADVAEALVVSNSAVDIAAGVHAGSRRVVGVSPTEDGAAALRSAGADVVVTALRDVADAAAIARVSAA